MPQFTSYCAHGERKKENSAENNTVLILLKLLQHPDHYCYYYNYSETFFVQQHLLQILQARDHTIISHHSYLLHYYITIYHYCSCLKFCVTSDSFLIYFNFDQIHKTTDRVINITHTMSVRCSAVRILEISNRIEQLLQYLIGFETSTIIGNFRILTISFLLI